MVCTWSCCVRVQEATTSKPFTIVCKRVLYVRGSGLYVRAERPVLRKFSLDNGCTQPCCTKMRRMQRLHTGTQMFGVALGCSSLLPRLECTWGKIVIIIKFRLVCLILRVAGPRGYFLRFCLPGHCVAAGNASNCIRIQAESRCNRCLGNHPLRDTSGSLGIPWNTGKTH